MAKTIRCTTCKHAQSRHEDGGTSWCNHKGCECRAFVDGTTNGTHAPLVLVDEAKAIEPIVLETPPAAASDATGEEQAVPGVDVPMADAAPSAEPPKPEPVADADLTPKCPADVDIDQAPRRVRTVTIRLTDQDLAELARDLAAAERALNDYEASAAETRKALKEGQAAREGTIRGLCEQIEKGERSSDVLCFEVWNVPSRTVELYRLDDRVFVEARPMSSSESEKARQTDLFDVPIGAGPLLTTAAAPAEETAEPEASADDCESCTHTKANHQPHCLVRDCGCVALDSDESDPEEEAESVEPSFTEITEGVPV